MSGKEKKQSVFQLNTVYKPSACYVSISLMNSQEMGVLPSFPLQEKTVKKKSFPIIALLEKGSEHN